MDDIIVSGHDLVQLKEARDELRAWATKAGFSLCGDKEQGPASAITAFNIHLTSDAELAIAAERLLELSRLITTTKSQFQRAGLLGYVRSVNTAQADGLMLGLTQS